MKLAALIIQSYKPKYFSSVNKLWFNRSPEKYFRASSLVLATLLS